MDFFLHKARMGDERCINGRHVREYTPTDEEERDEEIRARIAANNKATARQEIPKEE